MKDRMEFTHEGITYQSNMSFTYILAWPEGLKGQRRRITRNDFLPILKEKAGFEPYFKKHEAKMGGARA